MAPLCLASRLTLLHVLFVLYLLLNMRTVSPLQVYDRLTLLNNSWKNCRSAALIVQSCHHLFSRLYRHIYSIFVVGCLATAAAEDAESEEESLPN